MKRIYRISLNACLPAGLAGGCAVVSPATVSSGRLTDNEAIIETDSQPMLLVLSKNRCDSNDMFCCTVALR